MISKIDQKIFFQLKPDSDRVLSPDSEYRSQSGQFGREGDLWAFEVPLSDIGPLYFTCNSGRTRADLVFCKLVPMNSEYMIKKELAVYLRVHGSSDQKTDSCRFGLHPIYMAFVLFSLGETI